MGLSLERMLAEGDGASFEVTVVSNQDDGIVGYAFGRIELTKGRVSKTNPHSTRDSFASINGEDLTLLFSDRTATGNSSQVFDVDSFEKLSLRITPPFGSGTTAIIELRVVAWSNHSSRFSASSLSDLLVGVGPPLSSKSPNAVFTFSFSELSIPPH